MLPSVRKVENIELIRDGDRLPQHLKATAEADTFSFLRFDLMIGRGQIERWLGTINQS